MGGGCGDRSNPLDVVTGTSAPLIRWLLVATTTLLAPEECAGDNGHPQLSLQDGKLPLTQRKCHTIAHACTHKPVVAHGH